jgi:serine/threonine protein kinase
VICGALTGIILFGLLLTALAEDDKLHVSKNGIAFPLFLTPKLSFRRNRFWNELHSAELVLGEEPSRGALILGFSGTKSIALKLRSFKSADLEELLLAIELWGSDCERSPALIEYQNRIQNENKGLDRLGYTQMWEEELGRRFNATAFLPLEPGHTLQRGKLKVIRQLAFGGLSAIYLVQKEELDMFVLKEAVVPLDADADQRRHAEQHLKRESEMLFCLYHPNIAHVIDYFVEDDRNYLLLEYVNGQDLRQFVKQNGPQSEGKVAEWAMQIAKALQFVHSQIPPVIHRDVTPDNMVLKNDGIIVLIDFGAANEFLGTATGTLVGKQAFIAPEQLRGKAAPESDLYALGGTMFFLLTGRDPIPLSESDVRAVAPQISEEMSSLIADLTKFDRKQRVQTAKEALERLSSFTQLPDQSANVEAGVGESL